MTKMTDAPMERAESRLECEAPGRAPEGRELIAALKPISSSASATMASWSGARP